MIALRSSSPVSWKAGRGAQILSLSLHNLEHQECRNIFCTQDTCLATLAWGTSSCPVDISSWTSYLPPTDRGQMEDFTSLCLHMLQTSVINSSNYAFKKSNHKILTDVVGSPWMEQSQFLDPPLTKEWRDHLASGKCWPGEKIWQSRI